MVMLLLAGLAGCGEDSGRVTVTGTVLIDGKPLETGIITFGGPSGAAGAGQIQAGQFSLNEGANLEGVQPGSYIVLIQSWIEERGAVREDGSFAPGESRIPLIYLDAQKSGLKAEVTADGDNKFTFELSSTAGPKVPQVKAPL
jgi:hypothetical protein